MQLALWIHSHWFYLFDFWVFIGHRLTILVTIFKLFVIFVAIWRINFVTFKLFGRISSCQCHLLPLLLIWTQLMLHWLVLTKSVLESSYSLILLRIVVVLLLLIIIIRISIRQYLNASLVASQLLGGLTLLHEVVTRTVSLLIIEKLVRVDTIATLRGLDQILWLKKLVLTPSVQPFDTRWACRLLWLLLFLSLAILLLLDWFRIYVVSLLIDSSFGAIIVLLAPILQTASVVALSAGVYDGVASERGLVWLKFVHADCWLFWDRIVSLAIIVH